jgi:2-polyprenyl-3-methyl-5-hydroxy-6-metoxy-1,4-benzoquinol methylase
LLLRRQPFPALTTAPPYFCCLQDRAADQHAASVPSHAQQPDLSHVGLVLWQSGYVLADFLLLRLPAAGGALGSSRGGGVASGSSGSWAGVRVLELGCGGGTVGMFLALAGAQV